MNELLSLYYINFTGPLENCGSLKKHFIILFLNIMCPLKMTVQNVVHAGLDSQGSRIDD